MLTISFSDGTLVDIEPDVLNLLFSYEQKHYWNKEAGGVLIGKQVENQQRYIISAASVPTKYDKRSRLSFVRSACGAQPFIEERWFASSGTENYIGEWHTHPETMPFPSSTDEELIKQVIADGVSPFMYVILTIVGLNNTLYVGITSTKNDIELKEFKQIEVTYEHLRIDK